MYRLFPLFSVVLLALASTGFSPTTDHAQEPGLENGSTLAIVCHYAGHQKDWGTAYVKPAGMSKAVYTQRVEDMASTFTCHNWRGNEANVLVLPTTATAGHKARIQTVVTW